MAAEFNPTRVRRPRMTVERERGLLSVALDVLCESGYEAMSMDVVAARGRCSKATLYRHWQGKAQLISAALVAGRPVATGSIDTGTLRGDLLHLVERMVADAEWTTALFAALRHAMLSDAELAATVRTTLAESESAQPAALLNRAVERGQLPHRPAAAEFLLQLLIGAIITRPVVIGVVADFAYFTRFVDGVLLPALQHS